MSHFFQLPMRLPLLLLLSATGAISQCPPGSSILFGSNNQPVSCKPQESCSCSATRPGAFCQFSSQNNQFVCCGTTSNQCSTGSAQLNNWGQVQTCQTASNCATGFVCNFGTCCADPTAKCPIGNPISPCPTGQVTVNNQCVAQAPPGGQCFNTAQCVDNSACNGNTCQCQNNAQIINGYCIPFNGGPCQNTQVWIGNQCYTYSIVGGSCVADQQCVGGAKCQSGMCQCPQGTERFCFSQTTYQQCFCLSNSACSSNQVNVNGQCLNKIQAEGYGCQSTLQCQGNSQCNNGYCQCTQGQPQNGVCPVTDKCPLGSVLVYGNCAQQVGIGGQCSIDTQCLDNSMMCSNNICVCRNRAQAISGYCLTQSGNCQITQTNINGQCYLYSIVSGSCIADQQCLGGSRCQNNVCQCTQNTQKYCINQSGLQVCYCLSQSGTTNPCSPNQVYVNGQCLNTVPLGSFCQNTLQCLGNSQCTNGYCQCGQGQTQQGNQCVGGPNGGTQVAPGGNCNVGQTCLDGASCNGNICTCPNNRQAMNGYCLPMKNDNCQTNQILVNGQCQVYSMVGGTCFGNAQCLGGSTCSGGVCQCQQGVQRQCIQSSGGYQQCYCPQNGVVGPCNIGQVNINGQCFAQINAGASGCTFTEQCLGNSQCLSSVCQCQFGTTLQNGQCIQCQTYQVLVGGTCLDTASIGMGCTNQAQCQTPNSMCSGTCTCSSGLTYNGTSCISGFNCPQGTVSVNNGQCLSLVQLDQFCQYSAVCMGFGTCINSVCSCPAGTTRIGNACRGQTNNPCPGNQVLIGNQCYQTAAIGTSCIFTQQCLGKSTCQSSFCRCPSNTQDYGNGVCTGNSLEPSNMCSAGEIALYNNNNQLIDCFVQACPSSSLCKYYSPSSKYVCCRRQTSSNPTCSNPSWSVVYQNGSPINCLTTTCPTNSFCDTNNGQYTCCQQGGGSSSNCLGGFYTFPSGQALICTNDAVCNDNQYRYCRRAPGQSYSVCCDRA